VGESILEWVSLSVLFGFDGLHPVACSQGVWTEQWTQTGIGARDDGRQIDTSRERCSLVGSLSGGRSQSESGLWLISNGGYGLPTIGHARSKWRLAADPKWAQVPGLQQP